MLKKCMAFAVVLAVTAGVAFAQATFGGQLQTSAVLLSGNNVKDDDVYMGGVYAGPYTNAKFHVLFGDSTAGGRIVYDQLNSDGRFWGWMQWRANQYFRIKVGRDEDGDSVIGGHGQLVDWGFTGEAKNSAAVSDYNGSLAMEYINAGLDYGGFSNAGGFSLGLSFFPIDALTVSLLFKADFDEPIEISERFAKMQIAVKYNLDEVGTIRFAAEGNGGLKKDAADGADIGTLYLAFYSNELAEGLAFNLGGSYNLPHLNASDTFDPIRASAGVSLTSTDPFIMAVRLGAQFGGQTKGVDNEAFGFSIGLLPSYKLPKLTVFFHVGFGYEQENADADATTNWFVNPYVSFPMGGMRMWIGVQVIDEGKRAEDDAQKISWKIPFGFNFYF